MAEAPQEMSEALQQRYGDEMHFSFVRSQTTCGEAA